MASAEDHAGVGR